MFGMSFMQLGLMSTIANAIGKAISKIVTVIIQPIMSVVVELICKYFIIPLLKIVLETGMFQSIVSLVYTLLLEATEALAIASGFKAWLAERVIDAANGIFEAITSGPIVNMMGWTPINFFMGGGDVNPENLANPYFMSIYFMKNGVMSTAMIVFSLIVLIELFQITVRTEGMRNSGFETPFKLMIKVAICKILLDNTQMVLEAIFTAGTDLFRKLADLAKTANLYRSYSVDGSERSQLYDTLMSKNCQWYGLVLLLLQMGIQFVFVKVVMLVVPFILFGRVMEMYVYITLAPLPFATFASQELSQIGKNFLKQFIGISLKVVAMYIVLLTFTSMMLFLIFESAGDVSLSIKTIIQALGGAVGPEIFVAIGEIALNFGIKPIIFAIMLLMSIMGTDKYVKSITGAFY